MYKRQGQQRVTSLDFIKRGKIKVRFNVNNDTFYIENMAIARDPEWIRVDEIWNGDSAAILKKLGSQLGIPLDDAFDKYMDKIEQIKNIPTTAIPYAEIRESNYSRIAEMYMRLNEKGTKLKKAEINLALIVLQFPKKFYEKLQKIIGEFEELSLIHI